MATLKELPSQTAGPYVHIGCVPTCAGLEGMYNGHDLGGVMITGAPEGERMCLALEIMDGDGELVMDAMVEIWQPGPDGSFGPTAGFTHWGRQVTDCMNGIALFETLKPGRSAKQAPHILIWIAARGINLGLATRLYFPDEHNADDPVFRLAGNRAATMVGTKMEGGYHHAIHLQGEDETVFFDV
ncbi:MAG: protocatechuate 3,4-dioxygenase subunit alpha [Pseudomonadota bacterium]